MTICIAATCKHNKEPRIVLCSDWKSESYLGASENTDKLRLLPKGWVALIADTLARAEELVAQYETHLGSLAGLRDDLQLFEEMKKPAQRQKQLLADSYIHAILGMSYADSLAQAGNLPNDFVVKKLEEVEQIKLDASLILAGFLGFADEEGKIETNPYLFTVEDSSDHKPVVNVEDNFAVIGSGSYVATPVMHQRDHDSEKPLLETIYTVYEAKRLSEIVPGVGEATSIEVMEPSGKIWTWTDALEEQCGDLFQKIGPKLKLTMKKSSELFEFRDEFLEPFDDDEGEPKS